MTVWFSTASTRPLETICCRLFRGELRVRSSAKVRRRTASAAGVDNDRRPTSRSDGRWRRSTRLISLKRDGARSSRKTQTRGFAGPRAAPRASPRSAGSRYKLFWGADGYRPPEQSWDFLRRRGHAEGAVDPERVPYYLLIVGEPEEIPYRFQYLLDAQFAVGRITFDTPDEYARYARSVVQAETSGCSRPPRAAFFGVRNAADQATQISADRLVAPLAQFFAQKCADWSVRSFVAAEATKARLTDVLGGSETPRIFFSASHGAVFPCGHALQLAHQGALLCQDWPGPLQHRGPIPQDFYLAGEDVADDAEVTGMVAFLFACFSGGTPQLDEFSHAGYTPPGPIAPRAFVAALPKRLLAHPRGAALAVVAHVERAWGCSFSSPGAGPQLQDFESTLTQLAAGIPVGSALEFFNDRCSQLARRLAVQIEDAKWQKNIDELALADTWTAHNDARGYVIIGDPAVRLT